MPDTQQFLQQLFSSHGVEATIDGDWVKLPKPFTRCRAVLAGETQHPNMLVIQLNVVIAIAFGRVIVESFAGMAKTREDAIADALNSFVRASFHVILAAIFRPANAADDQVEREQWTLKDGERFRVTAGGVFIKGFDGKPRTFDVAWVDQLRAEVARHALPPGTHWVRVFHASDRNKSLAIEALLDNDTWPAVQQAAENFSWPASDENVSFRLFLILQSETTAPLGVAEMAGVIGEMIDADDDVIREELTRRGASPVVAEQAVALIPLAFGRVLVTRLGITPPTSAILLSETGQQRTIELKANPIFREASRLAETGLRTGTLTREQFESVALKSVEVKAINNALHGGSNPKDLVMSQPCMLTSHEWESSQPPSPPMGPLPAAKPWWRFWS